jgi:dihydroneopterin triphosphate diphosphatase
VLTSDRTCASYWHSSTGMISVTPKFTFRKVHTQPLTNPGPGRRPGQGCYCARVHPEPSAADIAHVLGRSAFQVLVFPYLRDQTGSLRYALFRRADASYWQGVAGGGEEQETPLQAARREAAEEAGVPETAEFLPLDSVATIPVVNVTGDFSWGPDVLVIPEYTFGVYCERPDLKLSDEHTDYGWFGYEEAMRKLRWDSNRNALWELNHRLDSLPR